MSFISDPQPFHCLQVKPSVGAQAGDAAHFVTLQPQTNDSIAAPNRPGIPPAAWPPSTDPSWEIVGIPRHDLEALYDALSGFLVFPGLAGYQDARSASEAHFATPRVIAVCTTKEDVEQCLTWARARDWLISTRSGGHNGAGFHLCNGITLDVQNLNRVIPDLAKGQVTVEAGAKWADVGAALDGSGNCLPGGTCGHVAVAGFTLGGGYSFLSRMVGLTCDLLTSVEILLANGTTVTASADEHPHLFWALRGGGGGQFGIVLSLTFMLVPNDEFFGFVLNWPLTDAPGVLRLVEKQYTSNTTVPDRLGYLLALTPLVREDNPNAAEDCPSLSLLGMFHGSKEEARRALEPLTAIGRAKWRWEHTGTFAMMNDAIFQVLPYDALRLAQARKVEITGFVDASKSPDWEQLARHIADSPHPGNLVGIEPYGGAIAAVDPAATAFPHRRHELNVKLNSYWVPGDTTRSRPAADQWLRAAGKILEPALNGSVYVNYMRQDVRDYRTAYWGDNFDRLLEVKQNYDPENVFRFEQSIQPR